MNTLISTSLEEFLASNRKIGSLITKHLKVKTVAELLMHTPRSITGASGLGTATQQFIAQQATAFGLAQRENDENVMDYLIRSYGSIDATSISVLNFEISNQDLTFYKPIWIVDQLLIEQPPLTIGAIKHEYGNEIVLEKEPTIGEMIRFMQRARLWGFLLDE